MAKKNKKYNVDRKKRLKSAVEDRDNLIFGSQMFMGNMMLPNIGLQSHYDYKVEFGRDIESTAKVGQKSSELEVAIERSSKTSNPS